MAVYGLAQDIKANQGRGVNLYIPGKTQLKQGDIFLGGTGTGVTDEMIGPATRIYGNTAQDTANNFSDYQRQNPAQPQRQYVLPEGARPTLAMRKYLAEQDQWGKEYNSKQDQWNLTYDAQQRQAALDNALNEGQLMGSYNGKDTLAKRAQAIQDAQFYDSLGSDNYQFNQTLASNNANAAADRYIKSNTVSATDKTKVNMASAMEDVQKALDSGTSPEEVKKNIVSRASDYEINGVTPSTLLSFVDSVTKTWGDDEINPNITKSNAESAWNSLLKMGK